MSSIERAIVVKYERYPSEEPVGYAIGFEVEAVGGDKFYIDTIVLFEEAYELSASEVAQMAWDRERDRAVLRADALANHDKVIGRIVEQRDAPSYFPWTQPGGAGDEYNAGEHVTHDGYVWISLVDGNVWEPGVYGWRIVDAATPDPEDPDPEDPDPEDPDPEDPDPEDPDPTDPDPEDPDPEDPDPEDPEGYPAWQPWDNIGPLYQTGDRVTHNGKNWEATVGNNHWEPGVYGWVEI